jgi:hypothetical protein
MNSQVGFSARSFWISYVCFSLIALAFARMYLDEGGGFAVLLAIVSPVPFFIAGYVARRIAFSILFALLVIVLSILFWLLGFPALGRFFEPMRP